MSSDAERPAAEIPASTGQVSGLSNRKSDIPNSTHRRSCPAIYRDPENRQAASTDFSPEANTQKTSLNLSFLETLAALESRFFDLEFWHFSP